MNQYLLSSLLPSLLLFVCAIFAPAAKAATNCSATAPSVTFGSVSLTGTTEVSATFQVTCSTFGLALLANAKVRMCLNINDGVSGGGNFNPRRMLNSTGDPLQFQLYTDAARSQIWGSLGNPTVPNPRLADFDYSVPVLGGSQVMTITIYGRVPTQTLVAGSYANVFSGIHTSINYRYDETLLGNATYPTSCISGGDGGATVSAAFPFTASATVPPNCRAYTTSDLDFGSVAGPITGSIDQTSSISMTCTGRTAWNVGLDNGLNASGNIRRMRQGATANHVNYELYRDSTLTDRWGNTIGTDTVPGTGTGVAQTLTVHGRLPAAQNAPAGNYSDTITVTVTY